VGQSDSPPIDREQWRAIWRLSPPVFSHSADETPETKNMSVDLGQDDAIMLVRKIAAMTLTRISHG
jgi:hypothetical protein